MANRDHDDPWVSTSGVFAHPGSPQGGGGPGRFASQGPLRADGVRSDGLPHPRSPAARTVIATDLVSNPLPGAPVLASGAPPKLNVSGVVVAGGPLNDATIDLVNEAAKTETNKRYIAYETLVRVGGSIAWRANNPGNLRSASTQIGTAKGGVGNFAVFATLADGRAAQKSLYLNKYGTMTVTDAVEKLTPASENDTPGYLKKLKAAGVDLDKDVKSQIDLLMTAIEANEGTITGREVTRAR